MNNDFTNNLDFVTAISGEMIEDHGEDSFYCKYDPDAAIVSAFDGCGGLGSRTYEGFRGHTGAYVASRTVCGAVMEWYRRYHGMHFENSQQLLGSLNACLEEKYRTVDPYASCSLRISGSMVRDLPTTAAIAYAEPEGDAIAVHVIWAGDSRVYLLDESGLRQITRDDVDSADAMSNLTDDGVLTNLLSSDGKYILHYKKCIICRPTVVLAATDGCFGYVSSPMEFEYGLLGCIDQSDSFNRLEKNLRDYFQEITGDDFTMGVMAFYFGTYQRMPELFRGRLNYMYENYMEIMEDGDASVLEQLWRQYKIDYERDMG